MLTQQSLSAQQRVPITLPRARKNLLWCMVNATWECVLGIYRLNQRAYFVAILFLLLALLQLVYLPFHWKVYHRVRKGEALYAVVSPPVNVSRFWSILAAGLLTAIVGTETFMCWVIIQAGGTNWIAWLIMAVVNLLLWGFVVYVWMRVLSQRPNDVIYDAINVEPQEGVWPPPPKVLNDERERE